MRNAILITLLTFCFSALFSQAMDQSRLMALDDPEISGSGVAMAGTILGKVLDASNGEPLIGANVFVTEPLCLLVRQLHHLAGTVRESLVHWFLNSRTQGGDRVVGTRRVP